MATKKVIFLEFGDRGPEIKECQKLLQAVGSSIKVTGEFTIGMVSAVRSFQKKNGLEVTGSVDTKTMKKLESCAKAKKPEKAKKASRAT